MKKLFLGLAMMVILGMIMWLVVERSTAQDTQNNPPEKSDKPAQPSQPEVKPKPPRPRPPMGGQQIGVSEALSNANIQKENQRHREVMDELSYQVGELQEKISVARRAKMDELNNQKKAEPEKGNAGSLTPEKIKEETDKVIESFRPETGKLAALISVELILYQKNLADILTKEQVDVNNKIVERILSQGTGRPPRPPVPEQRNPRKPPEPKNDANKPVNAPK
jgi:hypothetical protein